MIKTIALILIWAICLANALFFCDIIVNFFLENTQSKITNATTELNQAIFSAVMLFIIVIVLYFYTQLLKNNIKW